MIALTRQTLIRSLPVYGAVVGGLIAAMSVLLASTETLESAVWTTGVAALVPAAAPPLGRRSPTITGTPKRRMSPRRGRHPP